ncbi:CatA-like O-acetyltransferase [Lachnotalea glycerini]|uniref:Chloramphenicol acetyltransferase n=1 Tax=Lachnotalea glycerini TaxID=1763509 RepID=A0A371JJY5_9FIRM|nr:CatA-like O-acetyltransferase [Lachnotalea glycerini]RDY33020.1 chloramphenicol acetyltransferase [Lachnotalea glycerini]
MKYVDIEKSSRKYLYQLYKNMDYPYMGVTVNVDMTQLYLYCKKTNLSIFKTVLFFVSKAANSVTEFRYRLKEDKVIEYEMIHPSYTLLTVEDAFNFCTVEFDANFNRFYERAVIESEKLRGNIDIYHEPDRDDLIFVSCVPWLAFTQVIQPVNTKTADSIPRIAWGKYEKIGDTVKLPLGVQAHHALMDGLHLSRFYEKVQEYFYNIEKYL